MTSVGEGKPKRGHALIPSKVTRSHLAKVKLIGVKFAVVADDVDDPVDNVVLRDAALLLCP